MIPRTGPRICHGRHRSVTKPGETSRLSTSFHEFPYLYDGLGRRQQKTDAGGTVRSFVFDGSSPLDEYAPGLSRVTGGYFTYSNSTTYFNRSDHLGTPRLSTDYTGAVQRTEGTLMGPFGDNFTETMSNLDFTGFAGGFWDSENNGTHFGAREYQSAHGSWLSPDPAGMAAVNPMDPQSWNRYAYVGNSPATYNDPSGLKRPSPSFGGLEHAMGFASGGGVGFVGGCTQDGIDSNCLTNISLVGAGAASNCPQCAPGNPGGVGQLGTTGDAVYGWKWNQGSMTTDQNGNIQLKIGGWGYGVIGTLDDNGILVPGPTSINWPDIGIAYTKSKTTGETKYENGTAVCTVAAHCTAATSPPICNPSFVVQQPLIPGMSVSCYQFYDTTWLYERTSPSQPYTCIPMIWMQNATGTQDPTEGTCTH